MLGEEFRHHARDGLVVIDHEHAPLLVSGSSRHPRTQGQLEHEGVRLGAQGPAVQLRGPAGDHQRHPQALALRRRRLPSRLERMR